MFKSALDVIKGSSAKRGAGGFKADPARENGLFFATHTTGKLPFVFFRIGRELARKAGLALGDTVLFEWDEATGKGRIQPNLNGWKLVSGNTKSEDPPLILRVTWRESYPSIGEPGMCGEVIARSKCITFTYPKGTSYAGLAKKVEKTKEETPDELYVEHKKLVEREERVNKKARNGNGIGIPVAGSALMLKDGLPYGRRKGDKRARR